MGAFYQSDTKVLVENFCLYLLEATQALHLLYQGKRLTGHEHWGMLEQLFTAHHMASLCQHVRLGQHEDAPHAEA